MAVAGLPKLNDIKNAVTKAKEALSKYNSGKGSLKSLEDGISNLKSIQNEEYNKLQNLRKDMENKTYLNVDSYNTLKDTYNKSVENYQRLTDYLKSDAVRNDNADYKTAKNKYDSVYAIINSNRWYEESDAYKAALEKAGQANQKHNTARDWFDNNDYLKQNSGYQSLVNDYKNAQEAFNKARDFASGDNYLRDNSDYNNRINTFNDATKKLQDLNNWKSSEQYLRDNGGYQNAVNAANDRQNDLRNAESKLDNWDGNRSGSSWDSAVRNKINAENAYQAARNAIDTARSNADKEANKKIQDQENTRNTAENELNRVKGEAERNANTARENAERNYNTLREKEENTRNQLHDAAQNAVETTKELRDSTQSEAERAKDLARQTAQKAVDDAKTAMDAAENRAVEAAYPKVVAAKEIADANGAKLGNLESTLSNAAGKLVDAQDQVVSQKDGLLQTAQNKYDTAVAAIEPDLQTYNAYANDVVGYAKQFRENIGDVSGNADVATTKALFDDFNKLIKAGGFTDDIKNKITPYFNGIEFKGNFATTPETIGGSYLDVKGSKLNNFGQREVMYQYTDALSGLVQQDLTNQWLAKNPGKTVQDIPLGIKQGIDYLSTHTGNVQNLVFGSANTLGQPYATPEANPTSKSSYVINTVDNIKPVTVNGNGKSFTFDMSSPVVKLYNDVTLKLAAAEKTVGDPSKFKTPAEYDLAKLKEAGLWDNVFNDAGIVKLSQDSIKQVADKYTQYPEVDRFTGPLLSGYYDRISGYNNNQTVWDVINDANKKISTNVDAAGVAASNKFETDQNAFYQANYGMSYDDYKKSEQAMFDKMQTDAFGEDATKTPQTYENGVAIKGANAAYFSNIDPDTGLPILDQKALDKVLAKYGGGSLSAGEYRDNYNTFGWNVKSDGSSVKQGAAIWGVEKQVNPMGGYVWYTGDMKAVANQLGVDISGLKTQDQIFNAINNKVGDYYLVSNALDRTNVGADKQTPHASILFKSDGSGNLLPVTDETGNVVQSNYNSIVVHHGGASEQWAEIAPILAIAATAFAPQFGAYLNSAIGGIEVSAAVAPTAFTVGVPATTLTTAIGATGVNMIAGAIQNMVTSGLTNGDIGKAALTGALGPAISGNATQMLDRVGIDQSKINAIASATNTSPQQAANLMSNALTVGVTGIVLGNPDALTDAATSLAGQYVGTQAQNLVYNTMIGADPKVIASTVNAAGNVSNIATQTLINGGDVTAALENAMPSIITGAAKAGEAVGKADGPGTATIEERSTYPEPVADKYEQIIDAFGNPISKGDQYGDPLAALVGAQVNGTTLSDLAVDKTSGSLPTIFPNGTVQINPNVQYGKIYETTVDGQVVQARDAIRSDGEKVTIYFDPSTGEHASTQLTGNFNLSAPIEQTQKDILATISGGKILDLGSLTSLYKYTPEGDSIVEAPSGKFYALKKDGTNQELNQNDLSKALVPAGKSSNGMPMLQAPDGSLYVANTKTLEIEKANINALFSFGTPPPEITNNIALAGTGSTSTVQQDKFGLIAQDFGTPEEKLQAITDVETWEKQIQNDPKATAEQKTKAAEITKAIKDANVTNVQPEVKQPDVTPPVVKPPEVKPTETKPDTTTTAGGSSTAAPTPAPTPTPQQKVDELQKQADAAQAQVLNSANNYIQNPTAENKAKANAAVLDYELAAKIADAAKADLVSKPEIPLPKDGGSPANQPTEAPSGSQQTGAQQPTQTPGTQQPAQPGVPLPAQPGSQTPSPPGSQTSQTPTTPSSGSSNLPGDSLSTIPGPGGTGTQGTATSGTGTNANGTGTGGTGAGGIGAGGTGTGGTGTGGSGTGTGTGVGSGTDISGVLAALAGAFGSGKVSTGALAQIPQGYVATTTPLAKRPIGDLFPVSFTMMTPEEIAARSSTKIVRRGGLVSIRK